jgi:predicted transcriptional regulator
MSNGEGALDHRTRKVIFNYIASNPGVSFGSVRKYFDLNESTLKYHLNYLERSKQVTSRREGRLRCYFCMRNNGFDLSQIPQTTLNQLNKNQRVILNMIIHNPGLGKSDLIVRTKLNRKTLEYNLDKLTELKLIWKVKTEGAELGYEFITKESLRQEIYNRLLMKLLTDEIDENTFKKIKKKLERMEVDELMK